MTHYLPDTHAIYWHESRDPRLSPAAAAAFADARAGRARLVGYAVVLAELYYLYKKVGYVARFAPLLEFVRTSPIYRFEPITLDDVGRLADVTEVPEMHDRLIVIAAERLGATIITCDPAIRASPRVVCLW